jgi:hypothetical protein
MVSEQQRKLNQKQIALLHLIYRFRFVTTDLVALYQGKKDAKTVYPRLQYLAEKGYIGRRFEPGFRLTHQPAVYFLLPDGLRVLRGQPREGYTYDLKALHSIRRDPTATDQFINRNLDILYTYCKLRGRYGDSLQFFTKNDLASYTHFPKPLPDAYLRLQVGGEVKQFFLDAHYEQPPFFVSTRRVKLYKEYADAKIWRRKTATDVPHVLALCDTPAMQKRLAKRMTKQVHPELDFLLTTKEALAKIGDSLSVWRRPASEDDQVSLEAA